MFSLRDLLLLTKGTLINVQEDIIVDLISLQTMGEVFLPPAVSLSLLRSFPIHLWDVVMLAALVDFQSITGHTLEIAYVACQQISAYFW